MQYLLKSSSVFQTFLELKLQKHKQFVYLMAHNIFSKYLNSHFDILALDQRKNRWFTKQEPDHKTGTLIIQWSLRHLTLGIE